MNNMKLSEHLKNNKQATIAMYKGGINEDSETLLKCGCIPHMFLSPESFVRYMTERAFKLLQYGLEIDMTESEIRSHYEDCTL